MIKTIKDVWPMKEGSNYYGIFFFLETQIQSTMPWNVESFMPSNSYMYLDLEYYLNRSGDKPISRMLEQLIGADGKISDPDKRNIANLIYYTNKKKWEHIIEDFKVTYDPIENYNRQESTTTTLDRDTTNTGTVDMDHTGDDTIKHTGSDDVARTGNDAIAHSGTETTVTSDDVTNKVNSYNGGEVIDNSSERDINDTLTHNNTDTTTYNSTDTTTFNSTEKTEYNSTETRTDNLAATDDSTTTSPFWFR